jgi:hypothetical protein
LIPKSRTGKKSEFGDELKKEYAKLLNSDLTYIEYNLEQQWLYQLGKMKNWPKTWNWKF